ncbi:hypothetical protein JCM19301_3896 [Jejuia pallidilutea]|nr:carboxypeptidase-like regulatory domain-containing protein [Jejuia pallidilutea]GAL65436.1 hypothetical protein JCM19301_3896 [Jejuia pallidilutea]
MKFLYKLIILSCLLFSITSYAQIKGKCVDTSGKGIPYVNISIKGKSIGTVSNQNGDFYLKNKSIKENDSLIFSHLNFNKKIVPIPLIVKKIELTPKVENLEEIVISHKKRKFKIVGNQTQRGNSLYGIRAKHIGKGHELGKIIRVRKNKVYDVKNIQFTIERFGFNFATFRINFYNIIDGVVDLEKINKTNLIYKINDDANVKIDLSTQHLSFSNNFLVAIEWIDFEENHYLREIDKVITIPSVNHTGPMYFRSNKHPKWKK